MIYKSKNQYYQAVIQFYGDCIVSGMTKGQANSATREKFSIASPDTVYKIIRRVKRRIEEKNNSVTQTMEGRRNG